MQAVATNSLSLLPLLSVNFIGTLGFSLILPFLIYLVNRYGGNEFIYGAIGATYSLFQLFGAPVLGRLSDKHGRRKILFLSQLGTLVSWIVLLVALLIPNVILTNVHSHWVGNFVLTLPLVLLFLGRALDGLTGGNISVANAYLVDISTEETQKNNFGKMAASSNLGFILGPVIGGLLGHTALGEVLPVGAAIGISLLALILIVRLPESKPKKLEQAPCKNPNRRVLGKETRDCFDQKVRNPSLGKLLKCPGVALALLLYFFIFLAFNLFYTAFPIHAVETLTWTSRELGFYFSVLSGMMIVVQGPVLTKLGSRIKEQRLVLVGSVLMALSFYFLTSLNLFSVFLAAIFFAWGNGLMWPSFMSILGRLGHRSIQGYLQGVSASAGSLASICGLLVGGIAYKNLGTNTFWLAAGIFVIVFLFALRLGSATRLQAPTQ